MLAPAVQADAGPLSKVPKVGMGMWWQYWADTGLERQRVLNHREVGVSDYLCTRRALSTPSTRPRCEPAAFP